MAAARRPGADGDHDRALTGFVLSELSHGGKYRTNWHCQPPDPGVLFRVTRETWTVTREGLDVRDVYEIEALDGEVRA
jgi:hypothetical protein